MVMKTNPIISMSAEPMRRLSRLAQAFMLFVCVGSPGPLHANEADSYLKGTGARLQTLDKITARIDALDLELNMPVRFGTLEITLYHCAYKPPEEPPEHAAFLKIRDIGYTDAEPKTVFSGWMFASSPAVSGLEHAVYDVSVTACTSE